MIKTIDSNQISKNQKGDDNGEWHIPYMGWDTKQVDRITYYKWEFLRLNEKYIADFKLRCCPDFLGNDTIGCMRKNRIYFLKKYGIPIPINPKYSMDDLLNHKDFVTKVSLRTPIGFLPLLKWDEKIKGVDNETSLFPVHAHHDIKKKIYLQVCDGKARLVQFILENKYKILDPAKTDFKTISISINLDAKMPDIEESVLGIISLWKKLYDKHHRLSRRNRYDKYDLYLKIYHFHKNGKTHREIAKILYPEDYEKLTQYGHKKYDIQPVTEKVKNNIDACKKLINGGYKIIR